MKKPNHVVSFTNAAVRINRKDNAKTIFGLENFGTSHEKRKKHPGRQPMPVSRCCSKACRQSCGVGVLDVYLQLL